MAVIECAPMVTPGRLAANRQNVPPETGRPAEDLGAIAEAIAVARLGAPAVIRRLLALARSAHLPVARAACGDLLQVRNLPDDVRAEVLALLAAQELQARAAPRRARPARGRTGRP